MARETLDRASPIATHETTGVTPPLERASALPASWYKSDEVFQAELEQIFGRSWVIAGHVADASRSGDFFTCTVGHEPIVVVRTERGELRAFINVCRHRGTLVCSGAGNKGDLQCPNHGWTYSLDGHLTHVPEFEGVEEFDSAEYGLFNCQAEAWGPWVFVNLDPEAAPLSSYLDGLETRLKPYALEDLHWTRRFEYDVACNWKVMFENLSEAYHLPYVHKSLNDEIVSSDDFEYPEGAATWSVFNYRSKEDEKTGSLRPASVSHLGKGYDRPLFPGLSESEATHIWLYRVFPNLAISVSADHLTTNTVIPVSPVETKLYLDVYFPNPGVDGFIADDVYEVWDIAMHEDTGVCELVQQGLRSATFDTGRLAARHERVIYEFQGRVRHALTSDTKGDSRT